MAARSYSVVVPDCTKETLMAKIRDHSVKGSVCYTDEFGGYNDLRSHGKHLPVSPQVAFKSGKSHINGIEGFWSFAKDWHRQTHGVDPDNFPLYLREHEFRFKTTAPATSSISFTASSSALNCPSDPNQLLP